MIDKINEWRDADDMHELIGDERQGKGNATLVSAYNIKNGKMPASLTNAHDTALNEPEDVTEYEFGISVILRPDVTVWSEQKHVSGTWLANTKKISKDEPILIEDKTGRWWIADGHHRIVWARSRGKSIKVLLIKYDKVKEIDDTFYSSRYESFNEATMYTNAGGDKFWGDVGAGVLIVCPSTDRILVALRSAEVNEPGTYGIFGGATDGDEAPEDAAKRELEEEAGHDNSVRLVPAYVYETPNKTFKYHNFIGVVAHEFDPVLDWETDDAVWVTMDELEALEPKHYGLEALLANSKQLILKCLSEDPAVNEAVERRKMVLYHGVRSDESVASILKSGFDLTKIRPNWNNDYAVSTLTSPKAVEKFFGRSVTILRLEFYGNVGTVGDVSVYAKTPQDYTKQVVESGIDAVVLNGTGAKQVFVYNPKAISRITVFSKATNESAGADRAAWQMTRQEWLDAGMPDHGMNSCKPTFKTDLAEERRAINDFVGLFEKPSELIASSVIGVPRGDMDTKNRDSAFAKKSCWHIMRTAMNDHGFTEDAREAIVVGRLLGYPDKHILGYIFRNYILRDAFGVDIMECDRLYKQYKAGKMTAQEMAKINELYPGIDSMSENKPAPDAEKMSINDYRRMVETVLGMKVNMKLNKNGSMRGYVTFTPKKAGESYVDFDYKTIMSLRAQYPGVEPRPNFWTKSRIDVYFGNEVFNQ